MKVTPKIKRKSIVLAYKLKNILYEIYTGISVEKDRWSPKGIIKGEGQIIAEKNAKIKRFQQEIELYVIQIERTGREYFHEELKNHLSKLDATESTPSSKNNFLEYFEEYILLSEGKYALATTKAYKTTKRHFSEYIKTKGKKSIAFESVTTQLLIEFNGYLNKTAKLSPATRGKQIKNIKAVMNKALMDKMHESRSFQDIKKDNESSPKIFLDLKEISLLNDFKKYTELERNMMDAFLFICWTGLRFGDYDKLNANNISVRKIGKKDIWYLKYIQEKTKEEVEVPVMYKEAVGLLKKYDNHLPKFSNAFMNRNIKEIFIKHDLIKEIVHIGKEKINGEFVKRELITIHTGRRSFCTNQYLQGTPSQFIMAASGHKTESAFRLYIKADQLDKAKGLIEYINY